MIRHEVVSLREAVASGRRFRSEIPAKKNHGWYSDYSFEKNVGIAHCECNGGKTHTFTFVRPQNLNRFILELTEEELLAKSRLFLSGMGLRLENEKVRS